MKTRYLACFGLLVLSLLLSGCYLGNPGYTRPGVYPIYPKMNKGLINRYQTIDTLSPELKWLNPKQTTNQIYELGIWETSYRSVEDIKRKKGQLESSWGTPVYYTNNIAGTNHQVAIRLKPNTYYNWSVHVMNDKKIQRWSSYELK